jgi:hypothetical protein
VSTENLVQGFMHCLHKVHTVDAKYLGRVCPAVDLREMYLVYALKAVK